MHPVLFRIGDFPIGTYGVILAIAALSAFGLGRTLARKASLDPENITDLYVFSLLAAFVGAKVAMIIGDFRDFADRPGAYLLENIRHFGAFYGGFIAAVAVAIFFLISKGIPFWKTADITSLCLALAQGIGRIGCFFAGCCYGKPTSLPWGMVFPSVPLCDSGTPIHPWPLYESIGDFAIFFALVPLYAKRRFDGQVFATYVIFYALMRGALEFLRGDEARGLYFGGVVSLSQILALLAATGASLALFTLARRARTR